MAIKFFLQRDNVDCGPTCIRIISKYYGRDFRLEYLRSLSFLSKEGASLSSLKDAAEEIGFSTLALDLKHSALLESGVLPCILFWGKNHFVVLYKISNTISFFSKKKTNKYFIADPAHGKIVLNEADFLSFWESDEGNLRGFALFLEPEDKFYTKNIASTKNDKLKATKFIFHYFKKYNKNYVQIGFAMVVSTMVSLILPFLTQNIVDIGIYKKDISFIVVILLFQIALFTSSTIVEAIRSQLLLHISSRINITIIADYLRQLMALPISFFESKMVYDLIQRVNDNRKIEDFISSSLISTIFYFVNLIVFSFILFFFSKQVFLIFLFFSLLTLMWTILFMKKRRNLDYRRFGELANSGEHIYEMLGNINEVKINSYEFYLRKEWQKKQLKLFKVNIDSLKLEQYQQIGVDFFDQFKNILITFISAYSVVNNKMTLGVMLSISYLLGQVSSPIKQILSFLKNAQSASIGIERLSEVYFEEVEESMESLEIDKDSKNLSIKLENVFFRYGNKNSQLALKDVSLVIPNGQITAIVGSSGSGKTTLIKLLLKFYKPSSGKIFLNNIDLEKISSSSLRKICGTVMQDGHIFNDTIERNIVLSDEKTDKNKLENSIYISNLNDVVESLPLGLDTVLGKRGINLSTGQKQRVFLARAIYKSPSFIFLDEATNSLDANNEREIVEKLELFFEKKTVVIVAHRLSTVKNADQIVVLEKGEIVEIGNHKSLIKKRGVYFNLIKNQLELDN